MAEKSFDKMMLDFENWAKSVGFKDGKEAQENHFEIGANGPLDKPYYNAYRLPDGRVAVWISTSVDTKDIKYYADLRQVQVSRI